MMMIQTVVFCFSSIKDCRLTEDSSHRQDKQLQQCVLFLIGQTQEAQFGHFGEVRDSSPTACQKNQKMNWYETDGGNNTYL